MSLAISSSGSLRCVCVRRPFGGGPLCTTSPPSSTTSSTSFRRRSFSSSSCSALGVIGAGQMGTGIALVAARQNVAGKVFVFDAFQSSLDKARRFAENWVRKEISKNRLSETEGEKILADTLQFAPGNDWSSAAELMTGTGELDFAIEAVSESLSLKQQIYRDLVSKFGFGSQGGHCVLASNTSSISITKLGSCLSDKNSSCSSKMDASRFIGMHFMNPVPVMTLVEIIRGLQTSDDTHTRTLEMVNAMKKDPATSSDRPGFIANRVLMPYINEAVFCLQEQISTREDIDKIMKQGTNVPMGPLTLADFIGLDTCLSIMRVLHAELGDSKYRPAPLLVNYVEAGWLGKKVGRGFYEY